MKKLSLFLAIVIFYVLVSWFIYSDQNHSNQFFAQVNQSMQASAEKADLVIQMRMAIRKRMNLLLKMYYEEDSFELDELNMKFMGSASKFIDAREKLLLLDLSEEEKSILERQNELAKINSPLQNKVAQLLLEEKKTEARTMLFEEALSGQTRLIDELLSMSIIYKKIAREQLKKMQEKDKKIEEKSTIILFVVLSSGLILIIIFIYINWRTLNKQTSEALASEEQAKFNLEQQQYAIDEHAIVSITDTSGKITYVNKRFVELSGYHCSELIGNNMSLIDSGMYNKKFWDDMFKVISKGKPWHGILRNKNKNGDYFWVDSTIVPFLNKDTKEPISYVSLHTDITEQIQHEQDLIEAKQVLEEALKAKGDFLSTMSHEIRTPMNAIIGMTGLALKTQLDKEQLNYISKTNNAAESLLGIINDILDFSKIESGKMSLENEPFNLKNVITAVTDVVHLKVDEKGLDLNLELDPQVTEFLIGDSLRLGQVFTNLVNNAVKFTEEGSITIKSQLIEQLKNDVEVQFSVLDTGIGINESQQSKLFQSFSQADTSITRKYGGTGLGLTICKNLVELMGGKIWVESEEGRGSCFNFTIHLTIDKDERVKAGVAKQDDQDELLILKQKISGAKILLVEDNIINQELAKKILSNAQVDCVIANNGKEALQELDNEVFDGVLMDLQMPVMNGYEATLALRKQEKFKKLPIIALSASVMQEDIQRIKDVDMTGYVTKPINVKELYATLSSHIVPENPIDFIDESVQKQDSVVIEQAIDVFSLKQSPIDIKTGLENTLNNEGLFYDMVLKFIDSYQSFEEKLLETQKEDEQVSPRRLIHTLKSAAATLGAMKLAKQCEEIEKDLFKDNINEVYIQDKLNALYESTQSVVDIMQDFQQRYEANIDTQPGTNTEANSIPGSSGEQQNSPAIAMEAMTLPEVQFELAEINQQLEGFDIAATEGISELIQQFEDPDIIKIFKRALYLTNEYEFEEAAKKLAELDQIAS